MNVHLVTVSFDKDLEWLKYSIESIKKFCKGYSGHTIILDDAENNCDKTIEYLDSIKYNYVIETESKNIANPYIGQQYRKLVADKFVPEDTDYICHVDSDCIFYEEHTPDVYFSPGHDVPDMLMTQYDQIYDDRYVLCWKAPVEEFLGDKVKFEFMRRLPLLYPPSFMKEVRSYIEQKFETDPLTYLQSVPAFSEFNAFGALAYTHHNHLFNWINTIDTDKRETLPLLQMWSHGGIENEQYKINSLLQYPKVHHKLKCLLQHMEQTRSLPFDLSYAEIDYRRDDITNLWRLLHEQP